MRRLPAPELPSWLSAMVPFERYCVQLGEHQVHVMERGEGPVVLCLHGNPTWGFLWRKVASALKGFPARVIMPDLVGLGLSDHPTDAAFHTLENHAAVVRRLVEALGLERLVLVVQDWGGAIGGRALFDCPERLAGVVVLNTVLGPPKPGFRPALFHRLARVPGLSELLFRGLGFPVRGMGLAQGDRRSIRGEVAKAYLHPLRERAARVAPLALARMVPDSMSHPSIAALEKSEQLYTGFRGPAAVVWGDRDPVLGRLRGRISRTLPQAMVTATKAGHFLQEEVPEDIARAIRAVTGAANEKAKPPSSGGAAPTRPAPS